MDTKLEKIAKLIHFGAAVDEIAAVVNCEVSEVQKLANSELVQNRIAELKLNTFESMQTQDDGWDAVENHAVAQILEKLQTVPDPDFALKAAAVANKAQRRGGMMKHQNQPITIPVNMQAVINLHPRFVQQVQNGKELGQQVKETLAQKTVNVLESSRVQQLLQKDSDANVLEGVLV